MAIDDRRRLRSGSLRVSTWRGDRATAVLSPAPERATPTTGAVAVELDHLLRSGVERVVTGALHRHELAPFLDNGFVEQERLHLLRHDLVALPEPGAPVAPRRGRRRDRRPALALDARAFDDFWTLDASGLDDAIRATPTSRFRVVVVERTVAGYAVTGISGRRGYLQRLAVDPAHHGRGLGRTLIADSLRWLRRSGADHALVNTQVTNERAFDLYRGCGFLPEPDWLTVLTRSLVDDPTGRR